MPQSKLKSRLLALLRWLFNWKFALMFLVLLSSLLVSTRFFEPVMAAEKPEKLFASAGGMKEVFLTLPSGKIHGVEAGLEHGPLFVFIHGSPGSWNDFTQAADSFRFHEKARLLFVDRPGYGQSELPHTGRLEDQTDPIWALIESRRQPGQPVFVVGHSYGGPVAMKLGLDHSDALNGVLLVAPTISAPMQAPRWYNRIAGSWLVNPLLGRWLRNSNREMMALPEQLVDMEARLPGFPLPIVYIQGGKDRLVPSESLNQFVNLCADCRLEVITLDPMDHFVPWSDPELIDRGFRMLLSTLSRPQ
ncbi:alpha/beta fold hydrolase [bacterium]|nr:alpha/beta fold hydrolase [bacterium]